MSELLDRLVALARPVWEGQPVTDEIVEEAADLAAQLSEDERQLASLVLSGLYAEQEPEIADSEIDADVAAKFNPFHDERGRFAGAGSYTTMTVGPGERYVQRQAERISQGFHERLAAEAELARKQSGGANWSGSGDRVSAKLPFNTELVMTGGAPKYRTYRKKMDIEEIRLTKWTPRTGSARIYTEGLASEGTSAQTGYHKLGYFFSKGGQLMMMGGEATPNETFPRKDMGEKHFMAVRSQAMGMLGMK